MAEALDFDRSITLHGVSRFDGYYLNVDDGDYISRTLSKPVAWKNGGLMHMQSLNCRSISVLVLIAKV